jgi:cytochrome c oxidase assembly factor CtaG
MAFYAFWGLTFATSAELLVPDWYGTITSGWPIDPLTDQHSVGPIIWAVGAVSTIALTATAALAWARDLAATADADSRNTTRSRGHR